MTDPYVINAITAVVLAICVAGGLVLWRAIETDHQKGTGGGGPGS